MLRGRGGGGGRGAVWVGVLTGGWNLTYLFKYQYTQSLTGGL